MLKILFITTVSHTNCSKNVDSYHRVYFLSRWANLTILAPKGSDFSSSARPGTRIINSPIKRKSGLILYSLFWLFVKCRRKEFDIIITEPSIVGICGFWGKLVLRAKWVVDIWDIPIRCHSKSNLTKMRCRLERSIFRRLYRFANLFVVSILPDFELKEFGLPPSKMLLLKNGIWLEEARDMNLSSETVQNTFNILCMRSYYTGEMGLDTLSKAFLALNNEIDSLSLTIIGKIPKEVEPQVADLKDLDNVTFYEFVEHEKLMKMIQASSVCVIPFKDVVDLAQTYPLKVLEYLSMGKPVVASNIAGIKRMIDDGRNGLLFNAGDDQDLAEKIRQLYYNKELRNRLSANAPLLDSEFDCATKNKVILERLQFIISQKVHQ